MNKIVILYDSRSGVTEKLAEAVAEGATKVKSVDVELLKIGTPFSLSKLEKADAIIFGSPNYYDDVTHEMKNVLDTLKASKDRLHLSDKIGGVFASYGWLGGFATKVLEDYVEVFGMKLLKPSVLIHGRWGDDWELSADALLSEKDLKKCSDLGKTVAEQLSVTKTTPPTTPQKKPEKEEIEGIKDQVKLMQQQLDQIKKKLEYLI